MSPVTIDVATVESNASMAEVLSTPETHVEKSLSLKNVEILPESSSLTEEKRLRELVKQSRAAKSAPTPSAPMVSKFVRIDNFQRPLNPKSLKEWLSNTLDCSFDVENIWLNSVKTHCYVDFPTVEAATAAIARIHGQRWPETNQKILEANYTSVSARNASTSAEAALRLREWKNYASVPATAASKVTELAGSTLGKRNIDTGQGPVSLLKNAMAEAAGESINNVKSSETLALNRLEGTAEIGFSTRRNRETDGLPLGINEGMQLGLDDFFRKTKVKPHLYWLPLSEEEVSRKKAAKLDDSNK